MRHLLRQRGPPVPPVLCATLAVAASLAGSAALGSTQPSERLSAPTHVTELDPATPEALIFDGAVLVGVDVHGRVLAALDERGDGRGDRFYMFRTLGPYQGPWSRLLPRATLIETDGGLAIFTADRRFGVVQRGGFPADDDLAAGVDVGHVHRKPLEGPRQAAGVDPFTQNGSHPPEPPGADGLHQPATFVDDSHRGGKGRR